MSDKHTAPPVTRLLIIGHDAGLSGAERSLLEIIDRLDRTEFEPVVLVPCSGPFVRELRRRSVECHCGLVQRWVHYAQAASAHSPRLRHLLRQPLLRTAFSLLTLPVRLVGLAAFARIKGIGLVYSNTITILDGALLARLIKRPHVWHLREAVAGNADLYWPWSATWLPHFIQRNATRVIVNSHALRKQLFAKEPAENITVIPNGIDPANFAESDKGIAPSEQEKQRGPHTAIIGRLNPRKGITVYLEALVHIVRKYPGSRHFVVGEGSPEYLDFLQRETQRLELIDHIRFTGFRSDIPEMLGDLDVVVNASFQEPFGRTLIEAMAMGIPVIATRSGGPEEIIEDGVNGLLVDAGDALALADGMEKLMRTPSLARTLGDAGAKRVREHFDLTKTAASVNAVLRSCLSQQQSLDSA